MTLMLIGCCDRSNIKFVAFSGEVDSLKEYTISIDRDSLNNLLTDTLKITEKNYNDEGQISKQKQNFLVSGDSITIEYLYDKCNRLKKELVKTPETENPLEVIYFYKNSNIERTIANSTYDSIRLEQNSENKYDSKNRIIETTLSQLSTDLRSGDTLTNLIQTDKYNSDEQILETITEHLNNRGKNYRLEYFYTDELLKSSRQFNNKDSLVAEFNYEYIMDSLNNWIERKTFKNGLLTFLKTREIDYN